MGKAFVFIGVFLGVFNGKVSDTIVRKKLAASDVANALLVAIVSFIITTFYSCLAVDTILCAHSQATHVSLLLLDISIYLNTPVRLYIRTQPFFESSVNNLIA